MIEPRRPLAARGADAVWTALVWTTPLAVLLFVAWMAGDILAHGLPGIDWAFLTEAPRRAGRQGGIGPILVSTLLILFVCLAVSLPLAVATALLLSEFVPRSHRGARLVRLSLDVLAGVPSIIFGIFGNAFFCKFLGMGFSIVSGGLTLACMCLPVLIRSPEQSLTAVPRSYRLGAAALGFGKASTIIRVILPVALPGIMIGTLLGVGRSLAETAALIFTSGYVDRMPASLWDSGRALSVHIFDLSMNVSGGDANAYKSAVVLLGLLLSINGAVLWMSRLWQRLAGLSPAAK